MKITFQNIILETRTTSSQLSLLSTNVFKFLNGIIKEEDLKTEIYEFLTKRHDIYDKIMSYYNDPQKKQEKENTDLWFKQLKEKLSEKAKSYNWKINDEYWLQFSKPNGIKTGKKGENYKFYITFKKGIEYYNNLIKLFKLLENLNNAKTSGTVSFKILNFFLPGLHDVDNLVIHFSNIEDKDEIKKAMDVTNFQKEDRKLYNRIDFGKDIDESDTQIIAKKIIENFIHNKNILIQNYNKDIKQYEENILYIINSISNNSTHRN